METLKCIKTRRSIKKFKNINIPEEITEKIINAARHAPFQNFFGNFDAPWEFIVVKNKVAKEKLALNRDEKNKIQILNAPAIIAICVDLNKSLTRWIEDGVAAAENALLAAHALGLGAVYFCGFSDRTPEITKNTKEALKLPKNIICVALILLGYPDEKPEPKELRSLGSMIHWEKW